ncbi:unnamed protein product [Sphagnum tenellum]
MASPCPHHVVEGPSGSFDIHNLFSGAPPGRFPPQYPSFPPGQYPAASNFSSNASSFPSMPFTQATPVPHLPQSNPPLSSLPRSPMLHGSGSPNPAAALPLDGARLMALLTTHSGSDSPSKEGESRTTVAGPPQSSMERPRSSHGNAPEVSVPPPAIAPAMPTAPPVNSVLSSSSSRFSSNKLPKGRSLRGEHVVYDVDVRRSGEAQPQLEVSPITVYTSDPVLLMGRQIAVNRRYICYGLRGGNIRILNVNTALRALLRGHTQRVTDMSFFGEDVHLLASASADGRVLVRKIVEGPSEDGKLIISDQTLLAIQIVGDWESCHPRVCWHSQMQDVLVVAIGKFVLTIDVGKVRQKAPPGGFTAEQPIVCEVESPLEGVQVVGAHEEQVTDLAVPSFVSSHVASASQDGTMRIWEDKTRRPLSKIVPHDGEAVSAVAFLSAPDRPDDHTILTAGPLNRVLKLWASTGSQEESLSKLNTGTWHCIQTLEFQSSSVEGKLENAFFNQLAVAPQASLILLANAKRNAIYAVHVEFGVGAVPARMNYLAEFSVTFPILSLTVAEEKEGSVQVYCVQTQAIQQYILDVSQCLPPPNEEYSSEPPSMLEKVPVLPQTHDTAQISANEKGAGDFLELGSATATVLTGQSVSVPPRSMTASSAFGSPVEVGHREVSHAGTERTTALDITKLGTVPVKEMLDDYGKPPSETTQANQSTRVSVPQVATMPVSQPEGMAASSITKPPQPSKRRSRSKSPTKPDMQYVPVSTASSTEELEKLEKPSDSQPESSSLTTPTDNVTLERAHSSSSSNSLRDDVLSREEREGFSSTSSVKSGVHPPHLITPFELMNLASSSRSFDTHNVQTPAAPQEPIVKDRNPEDTKLHFDMEGLSASNPSVAMKKESVESESLDNRGRDSVLSTSHEVLHASASTEYSEKGQESQPRLGFLEMYSKQESVQVEEGDSLDDREPPMSVTVDGAREQLRDMTFSSVPPPPQMSVSAKGRKNKNKTYDGGVEPAAVQSSPQIPDLMTPGSMPEGETSYNMNSAPLDPGLAAQVATMQDALNQLVSMQKELHKQMTVMVAVPVNKEGKRMEGALGQRMEKVLKAHVDAMWARLAEENAKREKLERERVQQVTTLLTNFVNKDMPVALERGFKKEFAAIGPAVAQAVLPPLQNVVATTVAESFQKGVTERMFPQLEKSVGAKLEGTVTRQLQTQFQTIGRQALQEALRTCFESTVIPSFERSCRSMFEQVESSFQHGMAEYTSRAQQELASSHSALASTLQETVASATSLATSLKGELAEGQRNLVALAENASASAVHNSHIAKQMNIPDKVLSLQHLEESLDPTIELTRLVSEGKLEEAFNKALSLSNVAIVSWLCMQLDEAVVFSTVPLPLSQGVVLSLVQQLGCDLSNDTGRKLSWIREAALVLNPNDPVLAPHMRPFLEQLYQNLHRQLIHTTVPGDQANLRLVIHVVNSLLTACK